MFITRKSEGRATRHRRIRMRVRGTTERPRLTVFRSLNHIYAQVVDDVSGRTVAAVDSRSPDFQGRMKTGGNVAAAKLVGELLAAARQGPGRHRGRVRPGRLPVPRPRQGARRGGARRWSHVLEHRANGIEPTASGGS